MGNKPFLGARQEITAGIPVIVECNSPCDSRGVVFEDEGETGYFYARDFRRPDKYFVDALHIYTVEQVEDRRTPIRLRIIWDQHYLRSAILLDDVPHGIFDFCQCTGFCRDHFPSAHADSGWSRGEWTAELREWFYPTTS